MIAHKQGKHTGQAFPPVFFSVETCLLVLNGRWTPLDVREPLTGTKRSSELQRGTPGVSRPGVFQKVLLADLIMVTRGLVTGTATPESHHTKYHHAR